MSEQRINTYSSECDTRGCRLGNSQDQDEANVLAFEEQHAVETGHRVFKRWLNGERMPYRVIRSSRAHLRQQIAQDIYSAVEQAPMSFVADRGETAVLLAELAIKRLEEAGWAAPADVPAVRCATCDGGGCGDCVDR